MPTSIVSRIAVATLCLWAMHVSAVAVAAEQTDAKKRFTKLLYDRIGAQWYARVKAHRDELAVGSVHVRLVLSSQGMIRDLRVLSNTSNERLAMLVLDAIKHVKIPPPPSELVSHGEFENDLTFKVYAN